jgi:hypothetical protein
MHVHRMCSSQTLRHQLASIAATSIRVTYGNARNANGLLQHVSKPLDITQNVLNFAHKEKPLKN